MSRLAVVVVVSVVAASLAFAGGYFWNARQAVSHAEALPPAPTVNLSEVSNGPRIVFRNTALGADYSDLGMVKLADPSGPRAMTPTRCERLYATRASAVCVSAERAVTPTYALVMLDGGLQPTTSSRLNGIPSRARMSLDGRLVSTTSFLTGHSYAQTTFSTETVIRRDGSSLGSLEAWTTTLPNGSSLTRADRNYWGVTFAPDDDTFYATVGSAGLTWLVRGSIAKRSMTALRNDAECPSLSPDGTKVAYKKRLDAHRSGVWRLAVLDIASNTETLLSETRSVDDQVEWLDDNHILYAVARPGSQASTTDLWVVPSDGSGRSSVLIENASSPAVVRT
jgi:hypothetical protein